MKVEQQIDTLNLSSKLIQKLQDNEFNIIKDVWMVNRKKLKEIGFTDSEIKSIIIALQLEGLDLNKKKYD
jgi:5-bromo-4-chloroindolyl phosphate hydrolysis protein